MMQRTQYSKILFKFISYIQNVSLCREGVQNSLVVTLSGEVKCVIRARDGMELHKMKLTNRESLHYGLDFGLLPSARKGGRQDDVCQYSLSGGRLDMEEMGVKVEAC